LGNRARKQREKRDKSNPKTNAGHRERALDALEIAAKLYPEAQKKKGRDRIIDIDDGPQGKKHARNEAGDNGEDLHDGPQRKKIRGPQQGEDDESDVEYGSDDEGNNWRLGGPVDEDEDSEIESDDAFGESDEEKFKDFTFGGSKSRQKVCHELRSFASQRVLY
jgi:U3 small nucleolar RNA-associated protein 14